MLGARATRALVEDGLDAVAQAESDRKSYLGGMRGGHLGVVARRPSEFSFHEIPEAGVAVLAHGCPLTPARPWRRADAREIAIRVSERGLGGLPALDGSYVVCIVDSARMRAHVVNDRTGSIPLFFATNAGGVALAPEGKALLRMLGLPARIDETGLIQVVNAAHPFGEHTLLEGVRRLRPGRVLAVDLEAGEVTCKPWPVRTTVRERGPANGVKAAQELFETIREAQSAVPLTGARDVALALTGGLDSRIVLATLNRQEGQTFRSFSWGSQEDLPESDPAIARDLARAYGLPHSFLSFAAANVAKRADDWVVASELLSANMGYVAAGRDFLRSLPPPELVLTGDHLIGLSAIPESVDRAIEIVTSTPADGISDALLEVATDEAARHVREVYSRAVRRIVEESPADDPKSVQDHLYLQVHAPGWLFSPGFFKEPVVPVFRPLMLGTVLDLVAALPSALRSDKTVLVKMLRSHLPEVARFPVASSFSLIDWGYEAIREESLRDWLEKNTSPDVVSDTPLHRFLDPARLAAVRSRFFSSQPTRASRAPTYLPKAMEVRRWLARRPWLGGVSRTLDRLAPKGVFGRPPRGSHAATFRLLARVALVAVFHRAVANGRLGTVSDPGRPAFGIPA